MPSTTAEDVLTAIEQAREWCEQLILLVGPPGAGKTHVLRRVWERSGLPLVNVNLSLPTRMLDLPAKRRSTQLGAIFRGVVSEAGGTAVLLDNLEILFDADLQQDPLRLLLSLSRSTTLVAAWPGAVREGHLVYAVPEHREHRAYAAHGLYIIALPDERAPA